MTHTPVIRKRLSAFVPLVPLDGAARPVAVSPDHRVALLHSATVHAYVSLNGALPATIDQQSWLCYGKGAAEAGDYSKPLTQVDPAWGYEVVNGSYRRKRNELARTAVLPPADDLVWAPTRDDLKRLAPVALAAEQGADYRPVLAMVKLEPDKNGGTLTAVACDGFRLHVQRGLPAVGLTEPLLIPAALITALLASDMAGEARVSRIDATHLRLDAHNRDGQRIIAATWSSDYTYPDWRQVIPRERPLSAGTFSADVLRAAAELTPERLGSNDPGAPMGDTPIYRADFGARHVTLDARYVADAVRHLKAASVSLTTTDKPYGPVVFEAGDFTAVVMPMRLKGTSNG